MEIQQFIIMPIEGNHAPHTYWDGMDGMPPYTLEGILCGMEELVLREEHKGGEFEVRWLAVALEMLEAGQLKINHPQTEYESVLLRHFNEIYPQYRRLTFQANILAPQ